MKNTKILAPVKGKVIPLEQVPDEVFAEKVLGDGVAIIPEDGKIYSPVDGTITTITDSLHAYGFETEDGIQMIVHFGLETVNLKGKGFTSRVKVGDKVKAGDLVAEVDLDYLKENHVETITPVIVCGGIPYDELMFQYGETEAREVLIRTKEAPQAAEPAAGATQTKSTKTVKTGAVLGVSSDMLADPNAVTHTLFGQEILVADYFVDILGKPALNMGVFVGIISGFVGANAYNKYYNFRKLPDALSFFNGKRFVPLVVIFYSAVTAVILSVIWPVVQTGINNFGIWIANSSDTSPILAPFVYGTLERLLLPFGLHHMLTIPMNYTSFGGTYTILTGANAGTQVFGQDPLWLAWVTDLINLKDAGDMAAYQNLLTTVTPARFKVGQMIGATGLLLGIALAMFRRVEPARKKQYKSIFFSTVAAVFLTGVTEPLEFMFMFAALPLYVIYAVLQGCAFAMAGIIDLRLHSFGNLEFITRIPMSIKAGLGGDIINFLICVVVFFVIGYFVAYFMIGKFKYATPGRLGNYMEEEEEGGGNAAAGQGSEKAERIIALLGGRENITLVDACMTRLRVTVKDVDKVADLPAWKAEGAMGLIKKDNGIQAVYGPKADVLKSDINDIL